MNDIVINRPTYEVVVTTSLGQQVVVERPADLAVEVTRVGIQGNPAVGNIDGGNAYSIPVFTFNGGYA